MRQNTASCGNELKKQIVAHGKFIFHSPSLFAKNVFEDH